MSPSLSTRTGPRDAPATSRSAFSPQLSAAHVGKSRGQEVRGSGPAGHLGPGGAERTPSRAPQPQPSSRLCLGCGLHPPLTHPGTGQGAAGPRRLEAGAGGYGHRGRVGKAGARRATSPSGSPGAGRLGQEQRVPTWSAFGFRVRIERSSPRRLAGPGGWPRAGLGDRRRHRHIDLLAGWG